MCVCVCVLLCSVIAHECQIMEFSWFLLSKSAADLVLELFTRRVRPGGKLDQR